VTCLDALSPVRSTGLRNEGTETCIGIGLAIYGKTEGNQNGRNKKGEAYGPREAFRWRFL
jgi:hypothetical protein